MEKNEILKKAEANEGMTVEEIMEYQKLVKPKTHTYGKANQSECNEIVK